MGILQARILNIVAQLVKNPPAMQETWVQSLGWEDLLEKAKVPTPVFWPGEFHGVEKSWTRLGNFQTSLVSQKIKESACNEGDLGLIPELERSPGGGHGNPLQYSCLENPMTEEPSGLQSIGLQRVRYD